MAKRRKKQSKTCVGCKRYNLLAYRNGVKEYSYCLHGDGTMYPCDGNGCDEYEKKHQ